eukprot:sb/3474722/
MIRGGHADARAEGNERATQKSTAQILSRAHVSFLLARLVKYILYFFFNCSPPKVVRGMFLRVYHMLTYDPQNFRKIFYPKLEKRCLTPVRVTQNRGASSVRQIQNSSSKISAVPQPRPLIIFEETVMLGVIFIR